MIVTLTGAYKNAGDHLIGYRGRQLLQKFVDAEVVNVDRKAIQDCHYDLFNKAKAVFLCGGPAYQKNIYPIIYPINLEKIFVPIIPYGLGFKAALGDNNFLFEKDAMDFVTKIHSRIQTSSARDIKTVEALNAHNIYNVTMTGCPAWYDIEKMDNTYHFSPRIRRLAFSAPATVDDNFIQLLKMIAVRYPDADRYITFHHGFFNGRSKKEIKKSLILLKAGLSGFKNGYKVVSFQSNLTKMMDLYDSCDLHIGYRVHAHLYCLSQRRASVLLSEDQRGVSQSITLGLPPIEMNQPDCFDRISRELDGLNDQDHFEGVFDKMKSSFVIMKNFLESCEAKK